MKYLLLTVFLFTLGVAHAQNPSPGEIGLVPNVPNVVQVLDSTNNWSTIGTINPTTHIFSPTNGAPPSANIAIGSTIVTGGTDGCLLDKNINVLGCLAPGNGVATALGVNVGSPGAFVVNGGALGTPLSGTATNLVGLPILTGVSGLGAGVATALRIVPNTLGGIATWPASNSLHQSNLLAFGAKCDGITDDTTAIQAWLNTAASNVELTAPPGTCLFSSGLTTNNAQEYTITGAGPYVTTFLYTGASTTTDLLAINSTALAAVSGVNLNNFRIKSNVTMTGGYALHAYGLHDSSVADVVLDGLDNAQGNGKICGGYWFDGAAGVTVYRPTAYSTQNCGDGVRVDGKLGGTAQLDLLSGNIGGVNIAGVETGFVNGLHMAGGFGGFLCSTNVHNNLGGLLIDNATVASANREFTQKPDCAFDTNANYGIQINDSIANGGTVDLDGWCASTVQGHCIDIKAWANGKVQMRGSEVYNNCGSGLYDEDATTHVLINSAVTFNDNGRTGLSTTCATWQGSNPGHGYGIEASVPTTNIYSLANPFPGISNVNAYTAGAFNANSGVSLLAPGAFNRNGASIGTQIGVEDAATNLLLGSGDLSNGTYWAKTNLTLAGSATESPDGGTNAASLTTAAGGDEEVFTPLASAMTISPGANYTFSIFVKPNSGVQYVSLIPHDNSSTDVQFGWFDIQNCTALKTSTSGAAVVVGSAAYKLGNGWCRLSITGNLSFANYRADLFVTSAIGSNSWTGGAGKSMFAWGGQVESGVGVTSYIVTAGASVTRAAGTPATSVNTTGINVQNAGGAFTAGVTTTKTAGACTFTVIDGIVTNIAGC